MTNAKMIQQIMSAGISEEASCVYYSLLLIGSGSVSDLARETALHRAIVALALKELQKQGSVSSVQKGKRTIYLPEDPQTLRNVMAQKQEVLDEILPTLTEKFSQRRLQPIVRCFVGKTGITEVYNDLLRSLKKGEVFFRYESPRDYKKQDVYLPKAYFERVCEKREIEKFVITNNVTAQSKPKQPERSVKVVPQNFDVFEYNITQIIYANKVAFIDFEAEAAWIVESERFALFQRQLFKLFLEKL
ncbi:hypothetical protein KBD34_01890 [Patescibacteria group bacterium]|nr:hypothetical protein [Patescibacteria group bacterium]